MAAEVEAKITMEDKAVEVGTKVVAVEATVEAVAEEATAVVDHNMAEVVDGIKVAMEVATEAVAEAATEAVAVEATVEAEASIKNEISRRKVVMAAVAATEAVAEVATAVVTVGEDIPIQMVVEIMEGLLLVEHLILKGLITMLEMEVIISIKETSLHLKMVTP